MPPNVRRMLVKDVVKTDGKIISQMDEAKITVEHYILKDRRRKADFIFEDGKFKSCSYFGPKASLTSFSLEDWIFVHDVAERILKIAADKNCEVGPDTKEDLPF